MKGNFMSPFLIAPEAVYVNEDRLELNPVFLEVKSSYHY